MMMQDPAEQTEAETQYWESRCEMEQDVQKLVTRIKRGADGEQELDLIQCKALKELMDLLDYHMRQHLHYRTQYDNANGKILDMELDRKAALR